MLKVSGNRRIAGDAILRATSSWFSHQMIIQDNTGKAVLNLVLETSGYHFHSLAESVFASDANAKYFAVHSEADEEHMDLGVNLLENQHPDTYRRLLSVLDDGWDMMETVTTRFAELIDIETKSRRPRTLENTKQRRDLHDRHSDHQKTHDSANHERRGGGITHNLGELRDFSWSEPLKSFMRDDSGFSASWVQLAHEEVLDPHTHPVLSMMVFYAGAGELIGDLQRPLVGDEVVVVPPGCLHGFIGGAPGLYALSIQFAQGLYTSPAKPRVVFSKADESLGGLLDE